MELGEGLLLRCVSGSGGALSGELEVLGRSLPMLRRPLPRVTCRELAADWG